MTTFNINDIFVQVFDDLFSYLGLNHKFMCEVPASSMNSTEEVNTLVGISGDMEGNIMFGYTDKIAKEISAKLMGKNQVNEVDIYVKAALSDFCSEFCKRFTNKIKVESAFSLSTSGEKNYILLSSNPTCILGEDMVGAISRVPSKKLFFKVDGEKFGIAYSLEQK